MIECILKNLLPISYAYSHYSNKLEWINPKTKKKHIRTFKLGDEKSRLAAIDDLNDRIDQYNEWVKSEKAKNLIFPYIELSHLIRWGINVAMSYPIKPQKDRFGRIQDKVLNIKTINSQTVYKRGLVLSEDQFVPKFNKMLLSYIQDKIEEQEKYNAWNEQSIWNQPNVEFVNWFHANGYNIDKIKNILDDKTKVASDDAVAIKEKQIQRLESDLESTTNQLNVANTKVIQLRKEKRYLYVDINNEELEEIADQCRFKSGDRINYTKLGKLIGCSDKKAKSVIKERLPYLL